MTTQALAPVETTTASPVVTLTLPLAIAEDLMATVAREAQDVMSRGEAIPRHLVSVMLQMQPEIRRGYEQIVSDSLGDLGDLVDLAI